MLRQNRFSPRLKLTIVVATLVLSTAALALSREALFGSRAGMQERQPNVVTVPLLPAFVPAGLPVVLTNLTATAERDERRGSESVSSLSFQATATGGDRLTNLNLLVLEFDQQVLLRSVDGFVRRVDLSAGRPQAVTLPIDRTVRAGHRLALAVERADGATRRWEAGFADLARGVAAVVAGSTASVSARDEAPAQPEFGAALCAAGSRRALALAAAGDRSGITSYTCNQQQRSFQFTFNGKALLQ